MTSQARNHLPGIPQPREVDTVRHEAEELDGQSHLSRILKPLSEGELEQIRQDIENDKQHYDPDAEAVDPIQIDEDGTITLNLPVFIVDAPTPYETKPKGTMSRLMKTRSFRALYRASESLSKLGDQPQLSYKDMGSMWVSRALLSYAGEEAKKDPDVTPEFYMRAQLSEALADVTAYTGSIIETHDQPRMVESYEKLIFAGIYDKLVDIGQEVMERYHDPASTSDERISYSGFAHELVLHMLQYRRGSALRFSTAASVYDDYMRDEQRFDATVYNLKVGREKSVDVQVKTRRKQLEDDRSGVIRVVYGAHDLHNTSGNGFWRGTLQASRELPTLSAILYEAVGETSGSVKLDQITERLHSKLFS